MEVIDWPLTDDQLENFTITLIVELNWAWWKSQPDIDREKVSRRPLTVDQTDVFMVDVNQTDVFIVLTSTRLMFSWWTSTRLMFWWCRCRPDWCFDGVDVDQTELFYWLTSWLTFDTVIVRQCPFYWLFHHAHYIRFFWFDTIFKY